MRENNRFGMEGEIMAFEQLPKDSMMLLSVVNTKLRDTYSSLKELCKDLDVEQSALEKQLKEIGYMYHEELNRFV